MTGRPLPLGYANWEERVSDNVVRRFADEMNSHFDAIHKRFEQVDSNRGIDRLANS